MSTFPSKKVTLVDVPGVRNPSAKFEYNFFAKDEMVNDTGAGMVEGAARSGEVPTAQLIERVERFAPRDVKISFVPPKVQAEGNEFITDSGRFSFGRGIGIENFKDKIYDERTFSNANFTVMNLQDTGIDGKLFYYVSGSVVARVDKKNRKLASKIQGITGDILETVTSPTFSLLDAAKSLNDETPNTVTGEFLVNSLNNVQALGARFINEEQKSEIVNDTFEKIKNFSLRSQISDRVLADVIGTIANDPSSIYADEAAKHLPTAAKVQQAAASSAAINEIALEDYELSIEPISYRRIDISTFQPRIELVGFIVDKGEVLSDGSIVDRDPVIVNSPISPVAIDTRIRYGATYVYSIKTVALVETQATSPESGDVVAATFLVSSEPSRKMRVTCVENVPPPPPTDVTGYWDYDTEKLTLNWAYPVNPQRDVKKFQVFRRRGMLEPFQLIREYDFDDSVIRVENLESPQPENVKFAGGTVNLHTDHDFTKDSKFVYSVCAVDAHGMTSNFSAQIEILFDRTKNRLVKNLISISGAPKSYPNMYIRNDLFEDTMKTSGRQKLTVYFNPEYLEVTRRSGTKLGLLATDTNGGTYRLQVINTDLQKASSVDISLKNLRTDN